MQYLKLFQSFEKSCCVFSFPLTCEENETQACIGVFQWCEAFSNLHPDQFRKGEGWDHYTVTVYVWCAPSVTGKIFNWNEPFEVFFFTIIHCFSLMNRLQVCPPAQLNKQINHLALTVAFHEPMMSNVLTFQTLRTPAVLYVAHHTPSSYG